LVPVASELAADYVTGGKGSHRLEHAELLALHGAEALIGGRLHREQRDDLEQVVLHHVPQAASGLVEGTAPLHPELLGQGDLDAGDVVPVPDRLEEGVGETEVKEVHDLLPAEKVVDTEDRGLRERCPQDAVELPRRGEIAPEWLLDDDARATGQSFATEPLDHGREQRGRNSQVMHRTASTAEYTPQRLERARVAVVTIDILHERQQPVQSVAVDGADA